MSSDTERTGARHARPLGLALGLIVAYAIVEVAAAIFTGSLSLLSDAGHMGTDALGLGMALAAALTAQGAARRDRQTYGLYRLEIMAAAANSILLLLVAAYAIFEGVRRLSDAPSLDAGPMLVVGLGGLIVNMVAARILRAGSAESMNVEGAYAEVMADFLGSMGVIAAALVYLATGWAYADPLVAIAIAFWIIVRAVALGRKALSVLVQAAPTRVDLVELRHDLAEIDGVTDVHDLHVWTLTSDMDVATAHLVVADDADTHAVLHRAGDSLRERWGIAHATLQVEPESHRECVEETW